MNRKIVATNRKARFNYHILETIEAGIVLKGSEVKSVRAGQVNLQDSYARVKDGEVFLVNTHIAAYKNASTHEVVDPRRERKLLLHRREINKLAGKVAEKGLTLIPLRMYLVRGKVKIELALARGKKVHDKREAARRRTVERELAESVKAWRHRR